MLWEAIMRYDYDDDDVGEAYKIIGKMQFCISPLSLYIFYYCENNVGMDMMGKKRKMNRFIFRGSIHF